MKRHYFFNIFSISLLIFTIKWFFFFYGDLKLDLITKIVFDLKDWQYFTFIYSASELNFNPSFNLDLLDLKILPFPVYSILFHAIFFSIFDIYGFILIEFFIILFFFYLFFNFFRILGINKIESIFLSLLIFCLPSLIDYFHLDNIQYIGAVKELYYLRVPRPSISHLYLFLFFLLLISCEAKKEFKLWQLAAIGSLFSFMFSSFYYNLAISGILFLIYYFYITFKSNQKITKYIKDSFVIIFFFTFLSIPTILILLNSEPDYLVRVGLVPLDLEKKKILLIHFIERIFSIKFIVLFIVITIFYLFLKAKKNHKAEGLNLLYFIFLSSFLSPIIFIILSPTISEIYHFSNMLVALTFFVLLIFISLILFFFKKYTSWYSNILKVCILSLIFIYSLNSYSVANRSSLSLEKIHLNELIKQIKKINIDKDASILTFDGKVQTILILDDYKNFNNVLGFYSTLNDEMIESNLINIFKFLKLKSDDFNRFIQNKKHGWRYINSNIGNTFYMKYQANRLTTFENSMDFNNEELAHISKSSPFHSQQLIIPNFEIKRLNEKFMDFSKIKALDPTLIIINSNDLFTNNSIIDEKIYCSMTINNTYTIFFLKKDNQKC